jgi:hypothetical protein
LRASGIGFFGGFEFRASGPPLATEYVEYEGGEKGDACDSPDGYADYCARGEGFAGALVAAAA